MKTLIRVIVCMSLVSVGACAEQPGKKKDETKTETKTEKSADGKTETKTETKTVTDEKK
jgi:uncharacterized protein YdeI (BOF family)